MKGSPRPKFVAIAAFSLLLGVAVPITARTMVGASAATISAVPRAQCGPGSDPETGMQGRVSADDVASGGAARGYTCNTAVVSHVSTAGGFRVQRYADKSGHVCAFYDSTLLFPTNALIGSTHKTGVFVLDMTDPRHPVQTAELVTPAMQSPHESLSLNVPRGLLAADLGNPFTYPGVVDIYSVADDCRHPALQSSLPIGAFGHEGAFSPDGRTFWVSAAGGGTLTAIDVSNPAAPVPLWIKTGIYVHGLNIGRNGNSLYYAALGYNGESPGLTILDVNEIQRRVLVHPLGPPRLRHSRPLSPEGARLLQRPCPSGSAGWSREQLCDERARVRLAARPDLVLGRQRRLLRGEGHERRVAVPDVRRAVSGLHARSEDPPDKTLFLSLGPGTIEHTFASP